MRIIYYYRIKSIDGAFFHIKNIHAALEEINCPTKLSGPNIFHQKNNSDKINTRSFYKIFWKIKKYIPNFLYELMEYLYHFISVPRGFIDCLLFKPDIIIARHAINDFTPLILAKIFNRPLFTEVNFLYSFLNDDRRILTNRKLANIVEKFILQKSDVIFTISPALRKITSDILGKETILLPNGVNKKFKLNSKKIYGEEIKFKNKLNIVFSGFLRKWYFFDENILEIAKKHNVYILGPKINEFPKDDNFIFTDTLPEKKYYALLDQMDIAIIPQIPNISCPLKIFDYMARSLVIIAPENEICDFIFQKHLTDAYLFNKDENICDIIDFLQNNPQKMQEMANNANETLALKKFYWQENAKKIRDIGQDFLSKKK